MELKQVGEFGLIRLISENALADPASVEVAIGDDAAAFWPVPGRLQLLTTDMLVAGVHFELAWITPWQLGYKALAVNISDIAAMGGQPRQATVSLALPPNISVEFIQELYEGLKHIARIYQVNIVGGDTVSTPGPLSINITLTGDVEPQFLCKRSGAKPGDVVVVSGCLGNAAAGLKLLQTGLASTATLLSKAQLTPIPQVRLGQAAVAAGATAMNDVSDGLASEVHEIAAASQVGMRIYAEQIPLSSELISLADSYEIHPLEWALYGGEDYQLVFTMMPQQAKQFVSSEPTCAIVGEVTAEPMVVLVTAGNVSRLLAKGYNHFGG